MNNQNVSSQAALQSSNFNQGLGNQGITYGFMSPTSTVTQAMPAQFIVRWSSRESNVPIEQAEFMDVDEARNHAVQLVEMGRAHPSTICLYSKTDYQVSVLCNTPQPERSR